jgi:ABC-type amino acid transport substrate-binding protein
MKKLLLTFAFATTLSVTATIGQAQQIPDPRVADLVQAGKVRVGLFLPQFSKDAVTGELKGVRVEIARALAARRSDRLRKPPPSQLSSNPEHHLQQRVGFDCNLSIKDSLWLSISKLEAAAPVAKIPHCGDRGKHTVAADHQIDLRLA